MNHIDAPALLAYKAGDVLATIVDIPRQIRDVEINPTGIENLLKQYVFFYFLLLLITTTNSN